jgi:hypothetical protein
MDKIKINEKTWYTIEGIMLLLNIKSNKTVYNKVDSGILEKKKILGKTLFCPK